MITEDLLFYGIVIFIWMEYLWELYLSLRQQRVYKDNVEVPAELQDILPKATYEKARIYGLDKSNFSVVQSSFSIGTLMILIFYDLLPFFWYRGGKLVTSLGLPNGEILQSAGFMFLLNTCNTILNLPFNVYYHFVLEEKHGFNKQSARFFIKDKIKGFIVSQIIILPLICAVVYIIKAGGDYFFIYLWLFAVATVFFLLTIYPDYIAPLFDKYIPFPDGELKNAIEQLAASINFPLYKLYVVEGSKRSVHSNAYFYGFYNNKRIVIFDTLLKDYNSADESEKKESIPEADKKGCDDDEVLAVLGHELGHWKLNHTIKHIVILQVNLFLLFFLFGLLFKYEVLYQAFGFKDERPVMIGLVIVFQFVFSPYNEVLNFFLTMLSRKFEFEADYFAKSLGKALYLKNALIKLHIDNLGFPVYDWLFSMWHLSHPPLLERLKALDKTE